MRAALSELLADTKRYMIIIKLPRVNWETGKSQHTQLTLFEGDPVELGEAIDPRLLRARRVSIILADDSNGVLEINITRRTWRILQDSSALRDKLIDFNSQLISGRRTRFISPGWACIVLFSPAWGIFLAALVFLLGTTAGRKFVGSQSNVPTPPVPDWVHNMALTLVVCWPFFICIFLAMFAIISSSGALLVWPNSLTMNSVAEALYRVRTNLFTLVNTIALVIGIAAAFFGALFTWVLTR